MVKKRNTLKSKLRKTRQRKSKQRKSLRRKTYKRKTYKKKTYKKKNSKRIMRGGDTIFNETNLFRSLHEGGNMNALKKFHETTIDIDKFVRERDFLEMEDWERQVKYTNDEIFKLEDEIFNLQGKIEVANEVLDTARSGIEQIYQKEKQTSLKIGIEGRYVLGSNAKKHNNNHLDMNDDKYVYCYKLTWSIRGRFSGSKNMFIEGTISELSSTFGEGLPKIQGDSEPTTADGAVKVMSLIAPWLVGYMGTYIYKLVSWRVQNGFTVGSSSPNLKEITAFCKFAQNKDKWQDELDKFSQYKFSHSGSEGKPPEDKTPEEWFWGDGTMATNAKSKVVETFEAGGGSFDEASKIMNYIIKMIYGSNADQIDQSARSRRVESILLHEWRQDTPEARAARAAPQDEVKKDEVKKGEVNNDETWGNWVSGFFGKNALGVTDDDAVPVE